MKFEAWVLISCVYCKYVHGCLNLNDQFYLFKITLDNINVVKIIILKLEHQNLNPKLWQIMNYVNSLSGSLLVPAFSFPHFWLFLSFRYECELQVILALKSWIKIQHCFLTRHLWGKLKTSQFSAKLWEVHQPAFLLNECINIQRSCSA